MAGICWEHAQDHVGKCNIPNYVNVIYMFHKIVLCPAPLVPITLPLYAFIHATNYSACH